MARSVSVFLRANVTGFVSGMRLAGRETSRLSRTIDESTGRQRRAFQRTGQAATGMAIGLVGGFLLATKATMDFDRQMSAVEAAAGATAAQMDKLRKAALEAGKSTAFSATQAAQAEEELVKAGVSAADVIGGGLKGALDLASAGQLQVGEAAEVAATAMTQFGLAGKDVPHIADLLSAGANKAQGNVHQLGFALRMGGLVSAQFGLSVEDTVGSLSAFASAGLLGSDSGTSFKTMLIHLAAPSKKSADLMRELGINAYDSQGKFVGVTALAGQLEHQLGGLSQAQRDAALSIIFGTDGMRAANVLYKQGARGMEGWINRVNDSGNAARTAARKMNNLHGDLTKLKGAFTTALIGAGSGAQSPLRGVTQAATSTVNAFNSIPPSAQSATYWIAGISGGALLAARGLLFTVGTVRETRTALAALNLTAIRSRISFAALGKAATGLAVIAGVAYGMQRLQEQQNGTVQSTEALTRAMLQLARTGEFTGAFLDQWKAGALSGKTSMDEFLNTAKEITDPSWTSRWIDHPAAEFFSFISGGIYNTPLSQAVDKFKSLDATLAQMTESGQADQAAAAFANISNRLQRSGREISEINKLFPQYAQAQKTGATATMSHAQAEAKLDAAMTGATVSAQQLQDALDALSKANMDSDRIAIAQARAVEAATKASDHKRKLSLDEKSALLDLAEANQKQLVDMQKNGSTADELAAKQGHLASQFIKVATGLGLNKAAAEVMARRYGLLTSSSNLATLALGGYVTKVRGAADAARNSAAKTGGATAAQQAYTSKIQSSLPVLYALAGGNRNARAQVDELARASGVVAGRQTITRSAFLKAASAMGIAKNKARDLWKEFLKIKSRSVNIDVNAKGNWQANTAHDPARRIPGLYAKGGAVPSVGPESSRAYDSVPAMLRVDEHVWTPEEVDAVGGHAAMYRIRAMALAGKLRGYAKGGRVSMTGGSSAEATVAAVMAPIQSGYASLITTIGNAFAEQWKKFVASGGPVVQAARSQIGLPYSWGGGGTGGPSYGIGRGAGTYGYDCSGLTEYAWWQGRHKDIGGVTDTQWANSTPIPGPRPGALAFPSGPSVHVMLGSSKPGYVIQAPYTGSHVQEVPRTSSNWRWPTGLAAGGEVKLGQLVTAGRAARDAEMLAKVLQIAGSGPRGAERHTAQVAPAGAMRLWAEPETGGEAYIPLADSKRARSKQILAQVARRFGMGVTGMANGGILSFADGGTTADDNLNLSEFLTVWRDKYQPASRSDVDAAARARRTQLDQLRNAEDALYKARHKRHQSARDIAAAERRVRKEREDLTAATSKLASVEARYQAGRQTPAAQLGSALALGIKNTGAFMKNLMTLADRGFGVLAQQLLSMGGSEAESIAASAVKMSNKSLGTLQGQVQTAQKQQQMLTAMPNILTARSALRNSSVRTWMDLIRVANLPPEDLAAALRMMQADLFKTKYGKTIWAQMIAQGYQHGGWISGASGIDRVPIAATAGEFMVSARPAAKYAPALEAINGDRFDVMLRRYVHATGRGGSAPARGGDGASQALIGELHVNHVPGYSTPQDVTRALRQAELTVRYNRRR